MGGTKAELMEMFGKAVQAFNQAAIIEDKPKRDSAISMQFGPFLHKNAVVYPKTDGDGHYQEAALQFLLKECDDNPQFFPQNRMTQIAPSADDGTVATIHGQARWRDKRGPETLSFSFTFVHEENQWLFSTLWAA